MNSKRLLHFQKEILYLFIIAISCVIVLMPVSSFLSNKYMMFAISGIFILAQYFRVILYERRIIWMRPFAIKLLFGVINIPLFFVAMTWLMNFNTQLESYGYNVENAMTVDIKTGMSLVKYDYLKSLTYFIGTGIMIIIVLFQLRLVYSIFKYREVPEALKG